MVSEELDACGRSKGVKGEWIEKVYDYDITYNSLKDEEEWKEVLCMQKSCKRYLNWLYMNGCPQVKKREAQMKRRKLKVVN